ncbi:MAG: transcriptional activator NhaR [Planctomycetes bacterium]|nr:transcriptional activator NhaR [Planctomycetota bacterium]
MSSLNYHHLLYFRAVAREGGVLRASERLHLSASAISSQVKQLERRLGTPLLRKTGRRVEPTEAGRIVLGYADEIHGLGTELVDVVRGRVPSRGVRLRVGVADVVPKLVARELLEPAFTLAEPVQLSVREDRPASLFSELAGHDLDVVLSDAPLPDGARLKAFSHLLGESGITLLAERKLAERLRPRFPASLEDAPMLVPAPHTALRRALESWWDERDVAPRIVGEFDDSALLKAFGQAGHGVFAVPTVIEDQVREQHAVSVVGRIPEVVERFYAISPERRIRHPAVLAITRQARKTLFH